MVAALFQESIADPGDATRAERIALVQALRPAFARANCIGVMAEALASSLSGGRGGARRMTRMTKRGEAGDLLLGEAGYVLLSAMVGKGGDGEGGAWIPDSSAQPFWPDAGATPTAGGSGTLVVPALAKFGKAWVAVRFAAPPSSSEEAVFRARIIELCRDPTKRCNAADSDGRVPVDEVVERLLEVDTVRGDIDYSLAELCRIVKDVFRAKCAALWLYDPYRSQYELVSFSGSGPEALSRAMDAVPKGDRDKGIADWCRVARRPAFIRDVATWRAMAGGREYRVLLWKMLQDHGSHALHAVPLLIGKEVVAEDLVDKNDRPPLVTIAYANAVDAPAFATDALVRLGRMARRFISIAAENQREAIQKRLFALTVKALNSPHPRPQKVLDDFMNALRDVVADTLHAQGVSIFLYDRPADVLRCATSTGLFRPDGSQVDPTALETATYAAGEWRTWRCFKQNEPITIGSPSAETPQSFQHYWFTERHAKESFDSVLLYPISIDALPGPRMPGGAIGVIRCADYTNAPLFGDVPERFNLVQVRTLDAVTSQVAPIIVALTQRVARERAVAAIQHDMATPVETIRDMIVRIISEVQRLVSELDKDKQVPADLAERRQRALLDCRNVQASTSLLLNLVDELSEDPLALRPLEPAPTLIEGNIVARLKNMLVTLATKRRMEVVFGAGFRRIPPLRVDADLMERVFHNLLTNAVKYGHPETTVRVDALAPDYDRLHYVFIVSNEGIGIEEPERDLVFRPYFRSDGALRFSARGAGLGLSISRRIVEAHGGRLELASLSKPTVFAVYLPKSLAADTVVRVAEGGTGTGQAKEGA